ncbi:MAG: molybdopterin-dependent oxidoreductase [Candidatus Rokubacteria bacterium]|nr:molybdopterin-dependent oxidoreductase [Candidatus Rokubacteria bacterium]
MVRRIQVALCATLVLTAITALGRFVWGGPFPPEQMAEILFASIPVWAFTPLFRFFGIGAKYWAFAGMVGLHLVLWTGAGGWLVVRGWRTMLMGLLVLLGFALVLLPLSGAGWFGAALASGPVGAVLTLAAAVAVYGGVLILARRRGEGVAPVPGRRGFLKTAGFAVAATAGLRLLGNFRARAAAAAEEFWRAVVGLPPEMMPVGKFYTVSKNVFDPTVSASRWGLEIKGLVERPYKLTYEELKGLPAVTQPATLMCISNEVGGDLIGNAQWKGVRLKDLLAKAGIKPNAVEVILRAADGYSDSFPLKKGLEDGVLVVYEMNGAPLAKQHGSPARVIVPGIYGMKNVKWVTSVELADYDYKGYWEVRGWSDEAIYKTMSRIDVPAGPLKAGEKAHIGGVAFAGDRGIRGVEVSVDGGQTWRTATVKPPLGPFTWVLWALPWTPPAPGTYALTARAIEKNGTLQTSEVRPPLPNGSSGWHSVTIRVS